MNDFAYSPLGQVTENIRTLAVPLGEPVTFVTRWKYDAQNCIRQIVYPDGEITDYHYNDHGGQLRGITGEKAGYSYYYIIDIWHDEFGDKTMILYGNYISTEFSYDPLRRRLYNTNVRNPQGNLLTGRSYVYDAVSNVIRMDSYNNNGLTRWSEFDYDKLDRLRYGIGGGQFGYFEHSYQLEMEYSPTGRILKRNQEHKALDLYWNTDIYTGETSYELNCRYDPNGKNPFTLSSAEEENPQRGGG